MKKTNSSYYEIHALLLKNGTFLTDSHHLANDLHISDSEARIAIEQRLLTRRAAKMTAEELIEGLTNNDAKLNWHITYTYRDLRREHWTMVNKEKQKVEDLKPTTSEAYEIDLTNLDEDTLSQVVELLPDLFRERGTRDFIQSVLEVGKLQTMEDFNLTKRAFNQKMRQIEKYANEHRESFIGFVKSKQDQKNIKEEAELNKLEEIINNELYTPERFKYALKFDVDPVTLDELLDDPRYKHPGQLLENWDSPESYKPDEYLFTRKLNKKLDELKEYMTEDAVTYDPLVGDAYD